MSVKTGTIPLFSVNKINPIKICPLNTSSSSLYDAFLTLCKCIPIPFFQTERSFQGEFLLGIPQSQLLRQNLKNLRKRNTLAYRIILRISLKFVFDI